MYLVFDLETLPDPTLYEPATPEAFPPIPVHRPIVIGCVVLDKTFRPTKIGAIRYPGSTPEASDVNERALLESFAGWLNGKPTTLVSWFGRGFDVPVLVARSMRHGVPLTWYERVRYRYSTEHHIDLCDQLSEYGSVRGPKLDIYARAIGLPGKTGFDGSLVAQAFADGQYERIVSYCVTDCLQTAWVLLRWMLCRGSLTRETYRERAMALLELVHASPDPNLEAFLEHVNERVLLLDV